MVGSAAIAAAIAHVAFWLLLGRLWIESGLRPALVFAVLWLAGYIGLPLLGGSLFFVSYVAVLDIALVLMVFKGDVHIF